MQERNDLFAAVAEEGKEDLMDELDALEMEAVGNDFDMALPSAPITGIAAPAQPAAAQAAPQQSEEERQMAALQAMM